MIFYLYLCTRLRKSGKQMQEKHCKNVLLTEFAKIHTGGMSIYAFACRVCIRFSRLRHILRREICSSNPVPVKVFGDTWLKTDMST